MPGRNVKVGNARRRACDDESSPYHLSVARELRTDTVLAFALATLLDIPLLILCPFPGCVLTDDGSHSERDEGSEE